MFLSLFQAEGTGPGQSHQDGGWGGQAGVGRIHGCGVVPDASGLSLKQDLTEAGSAGQPRKPWMEDSEAGPAAPRLGEGSGVEGGPI